MKNLKIEKIVNVALELPSPLKTLYAVLCDRSLEAVEEFSTTHPLCFVFPFYTKALDDVPDYSAIASNHILQPYYVGNLSNVNSAIHQIVNLTLESLSEPFFNISPRCELECILDDTKEL